MISKIMKSCGMVRKADEVAAQFEVSLRIGKSMRAMALERDETARSLVLGPLQDTGLQVTDRELRGRRKATERWQFP